MGQWGLWVNGVGPIMLNILDKLLPFVLGCERWRGPCESNTLERCIM
jgi:hypothetical protein